MTVAWTTADGTATGGHGLHRGERRAARRIAAGATSTKVSVTTTEDILVEGAETFTVTLSRAVGTKHCPPG